MPSRLHDSTDIFILGVGAAYTAIMELIKSNERVAPRISKVFFFVSDQTLHSCRSATDDNLSVWYYDASLVFVAQNHHIWDYTNNNTNGTTAGLARKPKKRFGTLVRSEGVALEDMLVEHLGRVTSTMAEMSDGWADGDAGGVAVEGDDEDELALGTPPNGANGAAAATANGKLGSPIRLPPVGNFAISPRKGTPGAS